MGGEKQNSIDCNYYRVYGWMSTKLKLKGIKKEIYAIIYHYTTTENAKGYFDGSIAYLKQWTLTSSKHTIIEALKNLTDSNFVILVQDNSKIRKPNIYKANLDILSNVSSTEKSLVVSSAKTAPVENITSAKTAPDKCKKCTSTSAKTAPNNKIDNKEIINNNIYADANIVSGEEKEDDNFNTKKEVDTKVPTTEKKKKPLLSQKQENLFAQFWEIYPKKDDIVPAKKAWKKINPDTNLTEQIVYGAKMYAKEKANTDKQYIKKANNWLKDEAWRNYTENEEAAGNSQPQEVQPPAYKIWNGDEEYEPKPPLTEEEKAELEKRAKEAREKMNLLSGIISQN